MEEFQKGGIAKKEREGETLDNHRVKVILFWAKKGRRRVRRSSRRARDAAQKWRERNRTGVFRAANIGRERFSILRGAKDSSGEKDEFSMALI
jgi:hypothetical protein